VDWDVERRLIAEGFQHIAGVDEVGRGPLAGPVVAAAVVVPADVDIRGWLLANANDSKKMTAKKRELVAGYVLQHCRVGVGEASVEEIDGVNIRNATFLACKRALDMLQLNGLVLGSLVVDGNVLIPQWSGRQVALIGGDALELSVACASVVAKVHRDRVMAELGIAYPQYGWAGNAGYGTAAHLEALRVHGVCEHHRRSFAPVRDLLEGVEQEMVALAA
jgi:ribonuclease HII